METLREAGCMWDVEGDLPYENRVIVGLYLLISGVIVGLLCVVFLYVMLMDRSLHSPSILPQCFLILADLGITGLQPFSGIASMLNKWVWGPYGCQLYAMFGFLFGCFQMLLVPMIAFDRYVTLCPQIPGMYQPTYGGYFKTITALFCISLVFALGPMIGWARYSVTPVRISCTLDFLDESAGFYSYATALIIFIAILPMTVTMFLYYSTWRIRKNEKAVVHWAPKTDVGFGLTVAGCTLLTYMSYIAYGIVVLWNFIGDPKTIPLSLTAAPPVVVKTGPLLNILFHFVLNPSFRKSIRDVFCRSERPVKTQESIAMIDAVELENKTIDF